MESAPFSLDLTEADKAYMASVARAAIEQGLAGGKLEDTPVPTPESDVQRAPLGAFVTLKKRGQLRGCIGMVQGHGPLYVTVANMAYAAAFRDNRFPPLTAGEYDGLDMEISIMGPISPCPGPERIIIGTHGLILRKGARSGLLLPQVPVEWGWDVPTFLEHLCMKAGLPSGAWSDPEAKLLWFEAMRFDAPPRSSAQRTSP